MAIQKGDDTMKVEPGKIDIPINLQGLAEFKLIVESEDYGSWMAINNCFTKEAGCGDPLDSWYWNGVLVQLGQYWNHIYNDFLDGFDTIELKTASGPLLSISNSAFKQPLGTWINVVATTDRANQKPMDVSNLEDLRIANTTSNTDNVLSLHNFLDPYAGGITLWAEKGYNVKVDPCPKREVGRRFTFELNQDKAIRVDVYQNGQPMNDSNGDRLVDRHDITEIAVKSTEGGLPGGVHKNPPQKP